VIRPEGRSFVTLSLCSKSAFFENAAPAEPARLLTGIASDAFEA